MGFWRDLFGIEAGAERLAEGAKELADGIAEVDPLRIGQLLGENAELRRNVEALRAALAVLPSGTGIPTGNHNVQLAVVDVRGEFRLDAWLNDEGDGSIIQGKIVSDSVFASVPDVANTIQTIHGKLRLMIGDYLRSIGQQTPYGDISMDEIKRNWGLHTDDVVAPMFLDLFAAMLATQREALPHAELAFRWTGSGIHRLNIRATPLVARAVGDWRLRLHLTVSSPDAAQAPSYIAEFSGSEHPNHNLGTPLPVKSTSLIVRADR